MSNDILRDLQTDFLIQLMLDANRNVHPDLSREMQFDEEFKVGQFSTVPDEIYGKTYHMVDLSVQSESLIKKFEDKIKTFIDNLETRDKVHRLINELSLKFIMIRVYNQIKRRGILRQRSH